MNLLSSAVQLNQPYINNFNFSQSLFEHQFIHLVVVLFFLHVWRNVWQNGISIPFHLCKQVFQPFPQFLNPFIVYLFCRSLFLSPGKQGINKTWQNKQSTNVWCDQLESFRSFSWLHMILLWFPPSDGNIFPNGAWNSWNTFTNVSAFTKCLRSIQTISTHQLKSQRFQSKRVAINFTSHDSHPNFLLNFGNHKMRDKVLMGRRDFIRIPMSLRRWKIFIIVYVCVWCLPKIWYRWKIYCFLQKVVKEEIKWYAKSEITNLFFVLQSALAYWCWLIFCLYVSSIFSTISGPLGIVS